MSNQHAALVAWLLERARSIHDNIARSAAEIAAAERYYAPAHLDAIKAELEKSTDLAVVMANAAAAITELEGRLDDALDRLADVTTIEALVATLESHGIDALDELFTMVHDITSGP